MGVNQRIYRNIIRAGGHGRPDKRYFQKTKHPMGSPVNDETKLKYLSSALYVFGTIFIVGIWAMMQIWPDGWNWEPRNGKRAENFCQ